MADERKRQHRAHRRRWRCGTPRDRSHLPGLLPHAQKKELLSVFNANRRRPDETRSISLSYQRRLRELLCSADACFRCWRGVGTWRRPARRGMVRDGVARDLRRARLCRRPAGQFGSPTTVVGGRIARRRVKHRPEARLTDEGVGGQRDSRELDWRAASSPNRIPFSRVGVGLLISVGRWACFMKRFRRPHPGFGATIGLSSDRGIPGIHAVVCGTDEAEIVEPVCGKLCGGTGYQTVPDLSARIRLVTTATEGSA